MSKPNIFQMIGNFAKASAKYAASGFKPVTEDQYVERLQACSTCPHLKEENMTCGICGCYIEVKAGWQTSECPDKPNRWLPITKGVGGKPLDIKPKSNDK
jgi:hypothetical protein